MTELIDPHDVIEVPAPDKELDALAEMIKSDAWDYFSKAVINEWIGPRMVERLRLARQTSDSEKVTEETCGQILAQADAVEAVILWPAKRVQQLTPSRPQSPARVRVSRRSRA